MTRFLLSASTALALLAGGCEAQTGNLATGVKPALTLTGRVVDAADILDPATEQKLTTLSADLEAVTGNQFVVTTTPSLNGRTVEAYSLDLAKAWGVGRKDYDDGIMLLVAPTEKKVRIEVGYGLEARLTNTEAGRIIHDRILTAFRDGDMAKGIEQGSQDIVRELIRT